MISQLSSTILGVLRLLTPHEVKRLTSNNGEISSSGAIEQAGIQSLGIETNTNTDISSNLNHKPKLIPLDSELENAEEADPYKNKVTIEEKIEHSHEDADKKILKINGRKKNNSNKKRQGDDELESVGIFSAEKIKSQEEEILDEEKKSSPSASVFLMSEREKFKQARLRLKNIDANREYGEKQKKDSGVGGDVKVSSTGILLDKKLA